MIYPAHIYDEQRIDLATELLTKEYAKLFPNVPPETLRHSIVAWRADPQAYHLEDSIRDFWDMFAAVLESIKLKPSFTALVTAANYTWQKQSVPVEPVILSSPLTQITRLKSLQWSRTTTVGEVLAAIPDEKERQKQRDINDFHSTESQTGYPIIARQLKDGTIRVLDGNRRSLRAGLYGKKSITAWVATGDEEPKDFWVPVSDLFHIVKLYKLAQNDEQKQVARNSLELLFRASTVARINFDTRVGNQNNPTADELIKLKPTI